MDDSIQARSRVNAFMETNAVYLLARLQAAVPFAGNAAVLPPRWSLAFAYSTTNATVYSFQNGTLGTTNEAVTVDQNTLVLLRVVPPNWIDSTVPSTFAQQLVASGSLGPHTSGQQFALALLTMIVNARGGIWPLESALQEEMSQAHFISLAWRATSSQCRYVVVKTACIIWLGFTI